MLDFDVIYRLEEERERKEQKALLLAQEEGFVRPDWLDEVYQISDNPLYRDCTADRISGTIMNDVILR